LKIVGALIILLAWNSLSYQFTFTYAVWLLVGLLMVIGKDGINMIRKGTNDK